MITCIPNPGRCGGTLLLHILDKYFKMKNTPDYKMEYEVFDYDTGLDRIKNPPAKNYLFKYQYLFTHKPLLGADKYIIIDRRDLYAWSYSHYMTHTNKHVHGEPPTSYTFDHGKFKSHQEIMMKLRSTWEKEKDRLISHGAISLYYEDIKDLSAKEILNLCDFDDAEDFDKDDLYFEPEHTGMRIKLVPVWSCNSQ